MDTGYANDKRENSNPNPKGVKENWNPEGQVAKQGMTFSLGLQQVRDDLAGREAREQIPQPCFSTLKRSPAWTFY